MPLPDPKVLNAFFDYYFTADEEYKKTNKGYILSQVRDFSIERKAQRDHLSTKFSNATTVDNWIEILIEIGSYAEEAQNQKLLWLAWITENSKFCQTLHAIRTYIIRSICNANDDHALRFKAYIEQNLKTEVKTAREQYYKDVEQGLNLEKPKQILSNALLKLSYLGHVQSITDAMELGLFKNLFIPDQKYTNKHPYGKRINKNLPLCFQPRYFRFFYIENMAVENKNIKFSDFIKGVKEPGIAIKSNENSTSDDFSDDGLSDNISNSDSSSNKPQSSQIQFNEEEQIKNKEMKSPVPNNTPSFVITSSSPTFFNNTPSSPQIRLDEKEPIMDEEKKGLMSNA